MTTQHGEHGHRKRQQQDPRDAEDQSDHQHAEGGQQQDLAQQAGDEGASERVGNGIGDDLEVLPAEHHQAEAQSGQSVRKTPSTPGDSTQDALNRREAPRTLGLATGQQRGGLEGPDLAADLAAFIPYLAAQREHVARDHSSRMHDHVAHRP